MCLMEWIRIFPLLATPYRVSRLMEKWQREGFPTFRAWKQADNKKRYAERKAAQSIATALTAVAAPASSIQPAVDVWPFGLSPSMLIHPDWIKLHTPSLEPGSFDAGELSGTSTDGTVDRILSAKLLPTCGARHYWVATFNGDGWGATFNGDGCDKIMKLVRIDERGIDSSVEAEAAAAECFFDGQRGGACSEDVLDFGELLMGVSHFGWTPMDLDYLTDPRNEVDIFYRAYHYLPIMDKGRTFAWDGSGSNKRDGHYCGQCTRKIPDAATRWYCKDCEWHYCVHCAWREAAWRTARVVYHVPPAAVESDEDREKRKKRHRQREEEAIRELDAEFAYQHRTHKAQQKRHKKCLC